MIFLKFELLFLNYQFYFRKVSFIFLKGRNPVYITHNSIERGFYSMTEDELVELVDKAASLKTETDNIEFKKARMVYLKIFMIPSLVFLIPMVGSLFLE